MSLTSRDGGLLHAYFTAPAFFFRMSADGYVKVDGQQKCSVRIRTREFNIIYTYPRKDLCLASVQDPVVTHTSSCALATAEGECETYEPGPGDTFMDVVAASSFPMSAAYRMWAEEDKNEGLNQKVEELNSTSWSLVRTNTRNIWKSSKDTKRIMMSLSDKGEGTIYKSPDGGLLHGYCFSFRR